MSDRPHLSPTQLDMYCRCGEQWRRRYEDREVIPPGTAAHKGKGLHGAAKANFMQKIETHQDLSVKEIEAIAAATFDAEIEADDVTLTAEEQSIGKDKILGRAKDDAVKMAAFFIEKQARDYQPVLVEKKVRIPLDMVEGCAHDLVGIIDLADDQDRVIDFKTSSKAKSQADADTSIQLTTYAAMFHTDTGRRAADVRLDTVVQTKTKIYRSLVISQRDSRDIRVLAERISAVSSAIRKGVFTPASPGSWWCSEKWCGYARTCPYFNAERSKPSQEADE